MALRSNDLENQSIDRTLDRLLQGLCPYLEGIGFKLKRKRAFVKKIDGGRQELNIQIRKIRGHEAGYVAIFPNLIFEDVEKMAAYLNGVEHGKNWPTAAGNIGNLQPESEYLSWPLTVTADVVGLAELIEDHIKRIAGRSPLDFAMQVGNDKLIELLSG